jgi:hypothetical protein
MTKGTRWAGWRAWRRSRPFWGGLLLVLAGLELLAIPLSGILIHGAVKLVIYIGIGGVFGVLIGILLIAAGIMLWVNPGHRVFYGIAGIALGIVSFPASNLGGFFLGMLLAIIGGSIGFAWTPGQAQPLPAAPDDTAVLDEPMAGLDIFAGDGDEPYGEARPTTEAEAESEAGAGAEGQPVREGEAAGEMSAGGAAR